MAGRYRRQFVFMGKIRLAFGKAPDMHRRQLRQRLQHMVRTDLVATVGRERQAMGEEEDITLHPSPRAIIGPRRLAIGNGSRFHSAIRA